jgi:hypothetical protein
MRWITLVGVLLTRPELHLPSGGTATAVMRLRTDFGAEFVIGTWAQQAINAALCLDAGSRVIVCGSLRGRHQRTTGAPLVRAWEVAPSLCPPREASGRDTGVSAPEPGPADRN